MQRPISEPVRCYMVSWDEAHRLAKRLAHKIKRSEFRPDIIVGIARGGLVPARIICDFLLQKEFASIKVEHWGIAKTQGKARIKFPLPAEANIAEKRILVVDDVADTGDTCAVVIDYLKDKSPAEIRTAVMHYKTCSTFIPDYWGEKQDVWKWIIYPWAVYEDMTGFIEKVLEHPLNQPVTHEDIRKSLRENFDVKISRKEVIEILNDMYLEGKLERKEKDNKVFWVSATIK